MTQPTPLTWTLRLKSHRTTFLLHTDPLSPFSALKRALHTALTETGLHASPDGPPIPLPASPSAIQLGRPVDPQDPSQGFMLGEWEEAADSDVEVEGAKGKGKAKGKGVKRGAGGDCPKGAGLKDGAILAFRWEGEGMQGGEWEVQIASFEDAYGVQNESDVGARAEFEG
ncbi:hypothetical protein EJ07DRAFT_98744 [Lizonia empirigonia]|nr:hypothetical protein EJ07DRAFT_98744 [Lizonia empirigonia]